MHELTAAQQRAQEIFLSSAVLDNNFTPNSEKKIAEALRIEGFEGSASSVGRWKQKFSWQQLLNAKITAAITDDKNTQDILHNGGLEVVVKNTKVDVERNNVLIAGSYQFLELEVERILKNMEEGKRAPTEDEFDRMYKIARLSTDRHDKMLDRLANMPPRAISVEEVRERLASMHIEYEDAQIEETPRASVMTLTHQNEEE